MSNWIDIKKDDIDISKDKKEIDILYSNDYQGNKYITIQIKDLLEQLIDNNINLINLNIQESSLFKALLQCKEYIEYLLSLTLTFSSIEEHSRIFQYCDIDLKELIDSIKNNLIKEL